MKILIALTLFFGSGILLPQTAVLGATETVNAPGMATVPVISSVSAGAEHTCIVRDATVWCTGSNSRGQLGTGSLTKTMSLALLHVPFALMPPCGAGELLLLPLILRHPKLRQLIHQFPYKFH